jgi:hypothetical protein
MEFARTCERFYSVCWGTGHLVRLGAYSSNAMWRANEFHRLSQATLFTKRLVACDRKRPVQQIRRVTVRGDLFALDVSFLLLTARMHGNT